MSVCVCIMCTWCGCAARVCLLFTSLCMCVYVSTTGGRGGFGTVFFGGQGQMSSSCLGGGAAGETELSSNCSLGSATCPFCGAGGATPACSLCQHRTGGCRGRWAVPGQVSRDLSKNIFCPLHTDPPVFCICFHKRSLEMLNKQSFVSII